MISALFLLIDTLRHFYQISTYFKHFSYVIDINTLCDINISNTFEKLFTCEREGILLVQREKQDST